MKLSQLAAKPQLIRLTIEDTAVTAAHGGEPIEFWTWDRQPLDTFMQLASAQGNNASDLINIVRRMILDENGAEIIQGDVMLPTDVLMAAIAQITRSLGKS